jgi:enterochelin esterase-like enzyme
MKYTPHAAVILLSGLLICSVPALAQSAPSTGTPADASTSDLSIDTSIPRPEVPLPPGMKPLFNGQTLDGWVQEPADSWTVKDGIIASRGLGRGVLYTTKQYGEYRVIFDVRHVSGMPDHSPCVLFFGFFPAPGEKPRDALDAIQFQIPVGYTWDYRKGHHNDGKGEFTSFPHPKYDASQWSRVEILINAYKGTARLAVAQPVGSPAVEVADFHVPEAGQIGPFALQMHNKGLFDEYANLAIEVNPAKDDLITVQPAPAPAHAGSPEIGADRRVTFRLLAPKASEVSVSGEFMKGSQALTKNAEGLWSATVGPIEPEIYYYNFTIDGVRTLDPGNPEVKSGSTPSTIESVLAVHGDSPAFYDGQDVPHGEIRTHWYQSKSLGTLRRLTVYVPPGYDRDAAARLPVLYLFHGANGDEKVWTREGHANLILDNLLAAGKTQPFLVVMPFGYGVLPGTPGEAGQNTPQFSKDLLGDVIPFIDSHYRTLADRDHRAIIGLSMGGGESLSIGLNHLELFSYVAGFSAGLNRTADFSQPYASLIADPAASNQQLHLLWIGCGRDDGLFPTSKRFSDFLTAHQIKHTFWESSGEHTWTNWRHYLNEVAPLLFH